MHVISASRRTDIPAFHAAWFMNRIRAESVEVLSPFGGGFSRVSLDPRDVIAIVFWTKNAVPLLASLQELAGRGYCFGFLYTINNYPDFLEPSVPRLSHIMRAVESLAKEFSTSVVRWRYDTVVMTEKLDRRWHLRNFEALCRLLAPYVSECIFSFCDYYKKTRRNMARFVPDYVEPAELESKVMAQEMAQVANDWGIDFVSCAHDAYVSGKIGKARCIDPKWLLGIVDSSDRKEAVTHLKSAPTRKECGCAASKDIGAYDTCVHGCAYCYANANVELARRNLELIDPHGSCLASVSYQAASQALT